jgi:hypothetical protein
LFKQNRSLPNGAHILSVQAWTGNETINRSVMFFITALVNQTNGSNGTPGNGTGNETVPPPGNGTGEPRFTVGLNKLPQEFASGNMTDAELASIIRANKLTPGVINRLIKTGKLGNESINAIIETQKTPPGIFRKLFWLLWHPRRHT